MAEESHRERGRSGSSDTADEGAHAPPPTRGASGEGPAKQQAERPAADEEAEPASAPEPFILRRQEMSKIEAARFGRAPVVWFSTQSPGKRTPNEDALAVLPVPPDRLVLAIADGLGGQPAGDEAANRALRELKAAIDEAVARGDSLRNGIVNGFERANAAILDMGVGAGTTLSVAEIDGTDVRPYHVGDTEILILGQRGKIRFETVPHSPVGYAIQAGLLDKAQALNHRERHIVSNVVGSPEMRIDLGPTVSMRPRDTLLIASDGLFDNMSQTEIIDMIRKGPIEEAGTNLAETAWNRMRSPEAGRPSKPDDLTLIVFRLQ